MRARSLASPSRAEAEAEAVGVGVGAARPAGRTGGVVSIKTENKR